MLQKSKLLFILSYSVVSFSAIFISSCASTLKVPTVQSVRGEKPEAAWARVLHKYVDKHGRVDFFGIKNNPKDLHTYVAYVAEVSPKNRPELFKTDPKKLAYYINSYNALSMYNVIESDVPKSLAGLKKVKFFYFRKVIVGGEEISLYDYENKVIRKMGEERIHFALNCSSVGCPRLPRKPFTARNLEREFEKEARFFFNEERNVKIDHEEKKVYLSEILDFFPEDFLAKEKSLVAYANRYRSKNKKLPEDYEVDFIDYDWTINIQPGTRPKVE